MKILVSGLFLYPKKVGGVENYFYNLLAGFKKYRNVKLLLNKNVDNYDGVVDGFDVDKVNVKYNRGIYDYLIGFFTPLKDVSIVFSPNYITPLFLRKAKKVTTIHDVQYLRFPQYFSFTKKIWLYFSHLYSLYGSDAVVCISNSVKDDLEYFFGKKFGSKLHVIHNPISFSRFLSVELLPVGFFDVGNDFVLSVAAQYPHKNIITLVNAFNKFSKKEPGFKLVLVGQLASNLVGGNEDYERRLSELISGNENIIVTGYVDDDVLGTLYRKCKFFVFPSVFEGFGMPPVEAMGFGKPVIVTKEASLPEVTLNAAVYVSDYNSSDEFYEKMLDVSNRLDFYNDKFAALSSKVREVYSPEVVSNQYMCLFQKIFDLDKTSG